jgi:hypothetical protein
MHQDALDGKIVKSGLTIAAELSCHIGTFLMANMVLETYRRNKKIVIQ